MEASEEYEWDAFICHASEDKAAFVEPLVAELQKYGLKIWLDKFSLHVGSSLRESIDKGLAKSRFGIVVLSHAFFARSWPQKELNALFSRQVDGHDVILPVWHELTKDDVAKYSILVSDIFAARSSDGMIAVARSLAQVIRPTAFEFETSRADAQHAATRMREQLREQWKDKHPDLDCRITLGAAHDLDPLKLIVRPSEPEVIASSAHDGMCIDVFATDKEAYNQNPISFTLKTTMEGWNKLQEAQKIGKTIELGPEELLEFSSDFFRSFMLPFDVISLGTQRLVVGPTQGMAQKRFRFKLMFACGGEREEFSYVEFEIVRSGHDELVLRSSAPPMPLRLNLTMNFMGAPSSFNADFSYVGHEIRKIHKSHKAIDLLTSGGTLEIFDLESDQLLCRFDRALEALVPTEADVYLDKFIAGLYEIAVAFNEKVVWTPNPTRDDGIHIQILQEIIRIGEVSIPVDEISITLGPISHTNLENELREHSSLCISQSEAPDFAIVFGKTFEVGPYIVIIKLREFEISVPEGKPDSRVVRILPAEPLIYRFERFRRDIPNPPEQSAA